MSPAAGTRRAKKSQQDSDEEKLDKDTKAMYEKLGKVSAKHMNLPDYLDGVFRRTKEEAYRSEMFGPEQSNPSEGRKTSIDDVKDAMYANILSKMADGMNNNNNNNPSPGMDPLLMATLLGGNGDNAEKIKAMAPFLKKTGGNGSESISDIISAMSMLGPQPAQNKSSDLAQVLSIIVPLILRTQPNNNNNNNGVKDVLSSFKEALIQMNQNFKDQINQIRIEMAKKDSGGGNEFLKQMLEIQTRNHQMQLEAERKRSEMQNQHNKEIENLRLEQTRSEMRQLRQTVNASFQRDPLEELSKAIDFSSSITRKFGNQDPATAEMNYKLAKLKMEQENQLHARELGNQNTERLFELVGEGINTVKETFGSIKEGVKEGVQGGSGNDFNRLPAGENDYAAADQLVDQIFDQNTQNKFSETPETYNNVGVYK